MGQALDRLNPRRRAFAVAFSTGATAGNAAASYRAAGYSANGADRNAHLLMRNHDVAAAVEELRVEVVIKAETGKILSSAERLEILAAIARDGEDTRARIAAIKLDAELQGDLVKLRKVEHTGPTAEEATGALESARKRAAEMGLKVVP